MSRELKDQSVSFLRSLTDPRITTPWLRRRPFASARALQYFAVYVESGVAPVVVYTDHNPRTFLHLRCPSQRLIRWSLFLQSCNLDIQHIKGFDNVVADALFGPSDRVGNFLSSCSPFPSVFIEIDPSCEDPCLMQGGRPSLISLPLLTYISFNKYLVNCLLCASTSFVMDSELTHILFQPLTQAQVERWEQASPLIRQEVIL